MGEIILFIDRDFGGMHIHLFQSTPDLTKLALFTTDTMVPATTNPVEPVWVRILGKNWNDCVSSFVIISGTWKFFADANFQRQQGNPNGLPPGLYSFVEDYGITNDSLSSVQLVG